MTIAIAICIYMYGYDVYVQPFSPETLTSTRYLTSSPMACGQQLHHKQPLLREYWSAFNVKYMIVPSEATAMKTIHHAFSV